MAAAPPASELARTVVGWYRRHGRRLSFREARDPYHVLVAEIMLRKTTARQVDKVFPRFIERYPTIQSLARASVEEVEELIRPLGLRGRARHLVEIARHVVESRGGRLPTTYQELRQLPGVGDYIAACVAAFCHGEHVPLVDTNVERLLSRLYGLEHLPPARRREAVRSLYLELAPPSAQREFHYGLLDISATHCRPKKPKCTTCPLNKYCRKGK